jgi:hypothetical protein
MRRREAAKFTSKDSSFFSFLLARSASASVPVIVARQDDEPFESYQKCHHLAVIALGHLQSVPTTDPEFR